MLKNAVARMMLYLIDHAAFVEGSLSRGKTEVAQMCRARYRLLSATISLDGGQKEERDDGVAVVGNRTACDERKNYP
ncbi:hypothetical protein CERZMDRAFT_112189 [Cercospora zeae-maydis SCOH1-5]|uniref:Uncharacterized protein n=1 Tax=Cercospora zeae-maydis SCOH1-5 TaxID=717836 RepID=A0A6A6FET2_9PEZI|nr:hypothetical protein CERZMDRAFT_112189 [Cercospora zeae-maydis SCOH1-5]